MLARLALFVAALLCFADAARMNRQAQRGSSRAESKMIAGVPVYNYHLAYGRHSQATSVGTSFAELTEEQTQLLEEDWIVVLKPGSSDELIEKLCKHFPKACEMVGHPGDGGFPFLEVHGTEKELEGLLHNAEGDASFVEPDLPMHIIPEMPEEETKIKASTWGLNRIGKDSASGTGKGVHVYVLDTGVRTTHSDFGGRAIPTLEVTSNRPQECHGSTSCAADRQGHGTHCAGTIAGKKYGVAHEATIHAVKVLGDNGSGQSSWSIAALDWVLSKGQRPAVVSMSLGARGVSRADKVAIDQLTSNGVTVVVAAGNENDDACGYSPAHVPAAITVGATDSRDSRASYSNYGRCVDLYAPGSSVTSLGHRSDSQTATLSGTSMACPHVSGAAAILLEKSPSMSATNVKSSIVGSAEVGVISGLRSSSDPNKLLTLVGDSSGPRPTPAPTPPPSSGTCPSGTATQYPDGDGDCQCPYYTFCSTNGYSRNCPYSGGVGGQTGRYFLHTCSNCKCYSSYR